MADTRSTITTDTAGEPLDPATVAADISRAMRDLRAALTDMRETVLDLLRHSSPDGDPPQSTDLAVMQPQIQTLLDTYDDWICGAGFVAEPGVLADCTYWLEWRTESTRGKYARLSPRLEGNDFAKYDYVHADWFRGPRLGAERTMVGPYVDLGGVNKYLVTFTIPVRDEGLFLGVVGADVHVDRVEGMLRKVGRAMGMTAAILNEEGRIVAATIPRLHPGALVNGVDLTVADGQEAAPGVFAYRCGTLPWRLLVAPTQPPVLQLLRGPGKDRG